MLLQLAAVRSVWQKSTTTTNKMPGNKQQQQQQQQQRQSTIYNKTTNNRGIGHLHSLHLLGMALNFRFPVLDSPLPPPICHRVVVAVACVAIGGHVCLYLSRFLSNILRHSTARGCHVKRLTKYS